MPEDTEDLLSLFNTIDFRKKLRKTAKAKHVAERNFYVYDIKFYPYSPPGAAPVFALTGDVNVIVCRVQPESEGGVEVLRWFQDKDKNAAYNSLCWTYDVESQHPLVCVAGDLPTIKILDVITGEEVRTLDGHGWGIMDLVVSPRSPEILASSAADCEWMLPDFEEEHAPTDDSHAVRYPHFRSHAQHIDKVDCVEFYGDLVISKCATGRYGDPYRNQIILWRILGFSNELYNHPAYSWNEALPAKQVRRDTWSAFGKGWEQLLSFELPDSQSYWMRFGLFQQPSQPIILAIGNERGRVFFWTLEEPDLLMNAAISRSKPTTAPNSRTSLASQQQGSEEPSASPDLDMDEDHFGGAFSELPPHVEFELSQPAMGDFEAANGA
ncbi:MAG: hypothetical protein Q9162_006922 [Coniocarpon cinnabarinum]